MVCHKYIFKKIEKLLFFALTLSLTLLPFSRARAAIGLKANLYILRGKYIFFNTWKANWFKQQFKHNIYLLRYKKTKKKESRSFPLKIVVKEKNHCLNRTKSKIVKIKGFFPENMEIFFK